MSISALGSVWDSLGMGLVGKEYFRSWDSSQVLLWTPGKAAPPSLAAGSASTTVAAAMVVDERRLASTVLPSARRPEEGFSSALYAARLQSQRREYHATVPIHGYHINNGSLRSPADQKPLAPVLFRVGVYTPCWQPENKRHKLKQSRKLFDSWPSRISDSDTERSGWLSAPVVTLCFCHLRELLPLFQDPTFTALSEQDKKKPACRGWII